MSTPAIGINYLDTWQPGCWCAAYIQLNESYIREGEDYDIRHPAQWFLLLWKPTEQAIPFIEPDAWSITLDPDHETAIANLLPEDNASVYLLADEECIWSCWLHIPLASAWFEPWILESFKITIKKQLLAEKTRYAALFGDDKTLFRKFLKNLTDNQK
ncbi:MAG: hypothetical protein WCY98_00475 [Castellaniella sp.]